MTVAALRDARSPEAFGGKAASLAKAIEAGLPVPDGFAISWMNGDSDAIVAAYRAFGADRVAVRSSAIGEDSADASFAGQHVTLLNITSEEALLDAVQTIRASAHSEAALEYRKKMNVAGEPRIAIVVQRMVDAAVAGVLFTRNPLSGADERVIEAAWGLGESVVAGLVTPDRYRVTTSGEIVERTAGHKDIVIRFAAQGGTVEQHVPVADVDRLTLTDPHVLALHRLAERVVSYFGGAQDMEWAISREGELFLLQSRPITTEAVQPQPTMTTRRFTGLALAALLAPLNSTIIAVALPSIAGAFQSNAAVATRWLVTAYLVVSIVAQSPAGKLADLWGTSRVLTLGRALFGAGALLAAFSPSLAILGAGRVMMALGSALTIPAVFAEIRNSVPPERRGRVFGIFGAIMGAAAAIGPLLGGFLTTLFGWHSVFYVNVPVVLLSFLLEPPVRGEKREARKAAFDFLGSALLGVAVLCLVGAVGQPLLVLGAVIALVAFVIRELRANDPVLDVRLFRRAAFAAGSAIVALQNLAMYSMLFLLPFLLAQRGGDPSRTGRILLVFTVGMVLASPFGGRLSDAVGARVVACAGALLATGGALLFVMSGQMILPLLLTGAGIGIATSPSQAAALGAVSASQAGVASGALSTMRYIGGVIGSGFVALLASGHAAHDSRLIVFPAVLFASALVALALPGRPQSFVSAGG